MKRIVLFFGMLVLTAFTAFGQFTNTGKTVMYDSQTFKFLESALVPSNSLVVAGVPNNFTGTQTFYAVTLGGVTRTNWPTGIQIGDSYTNLSGFSASSVTSSASIAVNAMSQAIVLISMTNDITMVSPTNAVDGRKLEWRLSASGSDRVVTWPTNIFRIPSSSTLTNILTITNGTMSVFLTEYDQAHNRWLVESYISGY